MITKYIKGDITETELKYIAHGVNCQNKIGSGVAKALYTKFPDVKVNYHEYFKTHTIGKINLGKILYTYDDSTGKNIANCFTQNEFGYDGKRYVNYASVLQCFRILKDNCKGYILAIPKIGCGLAGGNWEFMEQLINDTVGEDLEIWVYEL